MTVQPEKPSSPPILVVPPPIPPGTSMSGFAGSWHCQHCDTLHPAVVWAEPVPNLCSTCGHCDGLRWTSVVPMVTVMNDVTVGARDREDARAHYRAAGGIGDDKDEWLEAVWYWRRAAKLWRERAQCADLREKHRQAQDEERERDLEAAECAEPTCKNAVGDVKALPRGWTSTVETDHHGPRVRLRCPSHPLPRGGIVSMGGVQVSPTPEAFTKLDAPGYDTSHLPGGADRRDEASAPSGAAECVYLGSSPDEMAPVLAALVRAGLAIGTVRWNGTRWVAEMVE